MLKTFRNKRDVGERLDINDKSMQPGSLPYIWKYVSHNVGAMIGLGIVIIILTLSILSPYIFKYDYAKIDMLNKCALPSWEHPFGCDEVGRDILVRVLYGARYTLSIGVCSVGFSAVIGCTLGAIAGYFGGKIDSIMMRILDIFQAFPQLLLAILVSAVLGQGLDKCIIALAIAGIPNFARMMRANIMTVREQEYVEAARSINCTTKRIIISHAIPNAISPIIVQISMAIAASGLSASSLSFLGLGVQPPEPEWGAMLATARTYIRDYPHMVIFPGLFIMLTVVSLNLIGDALRDALDPKLKN